MFHRLTSGLFFPPGNTAPCFAGAVEFPSSAPLLFRTPLPPRESINGSGVRGRVHGAVPAPCVRCALPCACGSRALWSADAFWADKYGTLRNTPLKLICMVLRGFTRRIPQNNSLSIPTRNGSVKRKNAFSSFLRYNSLNVLRRKRNKSHVPFRHAAFVGKTVTA